MFGTDRASLSAADVPDRRQADLIALDEAVNTLARLNPRQSQVVEMRFFGGLSIDETGEVLKVSRHCAAHRFKSGAPSRFGPRMPMIVIADDVVGGMAIPCHSLIDLEH